jgi:hypothetical protein
MQILSIPCEYIATKNDEIVKPITVVRILMKVVLGTCKARESVDLRTI